MKFTENELVRIKRVLAERIFLLHDKVEIEDYRKIFIKILDEQERRIKEQRKF